MLARSWPYAVAFCLAVTAAAIGDQAASTWAEQVSPQLRGVALTLTALGNSNYMLTGSALIGVVAWWRLQSTLDQRVRAHLSLVLKRALFFFVVIATSGMSAQVLKHVVGRARPNGGTSAFSFHPFSLGNAFASFPSGHATSAFAAVTALGLMMTRSRGALVALATAIGASRVILRDHYPSDVVSGAALGTVVTLGLARVPHPSAPMGSLYGSVRHDWPLALGRFFSRSGQMYPAALIAGLFAIAVPPTDLFGSEVAEHVKDSCAIMVALAGLTIRSLVVGYGQAPEQHKGPSFEASSLRTGGLYSICRHPLYAGNILIVSGIFLMHGNRWTVLFGTVVYVLIHLAIARAEETHLLQAFGTAYEDYSRRVPRWFPGQVGWLKAHRGLSFDLRRAMAGEYPIVGLTVVALAAAEFYEEIEEPLVGSQGLYLVSLGVVILGTSFATATIWLAGKVRWSSP